MSQTDPSHPKFQSIARASILASIENKHTQYVSMADRRAQGLLTMAAVLAPVAISRINDAAFFPSVAVFLVGAATTIIAATLCLFPKRFRRIQPNDRFPLHFSYISRQKRDDYLAQMSDIIDDTTQLSKEVAKDLYHLSHDVLIPKFRWLRIAYASFVGSLCLSLILLVYNVLRTSN
ncbi:hypothetical protein IEN85_03055 [Pelagicoccus sp. NFK12]|uniref:Pycsar effector protein domain-containing protein n=1 Tax=Pelagicoccus enzymogenes TaxID=2773457 RepID=A0A927F4T5_9BACT|nr:Pycsar system effector family protein [Pelagicoccus enzymogenes]MBD5778457.1 hypothetical protein [Pelagicoccus enzymogenes]MDQ8197182.1 DUF5706 domain-containing protein [Pelagicoccus enzymogenes]